MRIFRILVLFALVSGSGTSALAQDFGAGSAPTIEQIIIRFQGATNVSEQIVRANMQVREGSELSEVLIDRDIRSLYRTSLFEFIEVKRETLPSGRVNLVFELTPRYRVLTVIFDGNDRIRDRRLEKEISTKANLVLDERQVKEDSEKIREYYQKVGFNRISIYYEIDRDRSTGFGTVTFKISEGAKVRVSSVDFTGNDHVKARKLRKQMETKKWWFWSWLLGTGRFKDHEFEDDLEKLRDYYREEGYLDVRIPPEQIRYDYPTPERLEITIHVDEGRQYRIGTIDVTGATKVPGELLKFALKQKPGDVFVPSKLDEDAAEIEKFYGRGGHLDARVTLLRVPNLQTGDIDLEYIIDEGDPYDVESIRIEGNTKSKSIIILRELVLGPGEIFDTTRMEISKLRLENTRFFDDVNITPESTNIPGRRNLKVAVREGRTGNLTFGAGFSSLERAVIFAELTQSNFDIFNRRSFFQGDGQKFRLRLQLGDQSSEIVMSFEEPWLFEKQLATGFTLFRTTSDFNSAIYNEIRTGGEVYMRKRLFELVNGQLSYSYQVVDIGNISPSAPAVVQALAGERSISKVGFTLERDTRNKIVNTTAGNRVELRFDVAGGIFGGDSDYYRMEFRGAQFYPLFEFQQQVLAIILRGGVVDSYGDSTGVPFYEKFFLGGPYTLRGFEYREVGPKDSLSNEPIGGNTYGMLTLEYTIDIVSPVRFAIFYDAGFVNDGAFDFNPARYNDNFGVGLGLFVAGAPLRLDFGIPLTSDDVNDKGNQFNFSFGTRF
ncbi:outer membrane protein assembly factor BamA [Synoicihabitans lomoniglobus]|uniref:Outer membrane protein assembly factor BamA n=1 Tax=Synoicihabitans lomoniglobus TaxID=2909285 RepID=A0AAF0I6D3_9BACT|nr:outer membrane protein assembly factor BamA [Opitutaceae bacterium LMO-M01]WED66031.1 outer membrane protein assembly factor BamA [Opitutaceae bacterium LMO-M01]